MRRKPDFQQTGGNRGVFLRNIREVQFVAFPVEEQHRYALGAQHLAAFGDGEWEEILNPSSRRKSTAELVGKLPRVASGGAFRGHVERLRMLPCGDC
ncbi:MAG: hypothetical protein ACHQ4J_09550 [Candidatus Binatia bacterium]